VDGSDRDRPEVQQESGILPDFRQHRVQAVWDVVCDVDTGGKRPRQGAGEKDDTDRGPIALAQCVIELSQHVDVQDIQRWAIQADAGDPILDPDRDWNRWRLGCRHRR
jgi:hypothetical protein